MCTIKNVIFVFQFEFYFQFKSHFKVIFFAQPSVFFHFSTDGKSAKNHQKAGSDCANQFQHLLTTFSIFDVRNTAKECEPKFRIKCWMMNVLSKKMFNHCDCFCLNAKKHQLTKTRCWVFKKTNFMNKTLFTFLVYRLYIIELFLI